MGERAGHSADLHGADEALRQFDGFSSWAVAAVRRIADGVAGWPWWAQVGLVWVLGRLYTVFWTLIVRQHQAALPILADPGGYFDYASIWDGGIYRAIHDQGYPAPDAGQVDGRWAFLPVYPYLVRGITALTGLGWPIAATTTSALACLGFLLVAYRLFCTQLDHQTAMFAVAAISFAATAPILQFAYAEALAFFLVASALLLIVGRHYLAAAPLIVLAALAKPLGAPLFGLTLIVAAASLVGAHRAGRRWREARLGSLAVLVLAGAVAAFAWPVISAIATGVPNAYLAAEARWRGDVVLAPLTAFTGSAGDVFGPFAIVVVLTVILGIAAVMLSRPLLRLGLVMWAWVGLILGYLVLVAPISSSLPRQLGAAFPLAAGLMAVSKSRAYRWLVLLGLATAQIGYLALLWHITGDGHDLWP